MSLFLRGGMLIREDRVSSADEVVDVRDRLHDFLTGGPAISDDELDEIEAVLEERAITL